MRYFLLIFAVLGIDQGIKWMIATNMSAGETSALIEGMFHITYVRNRGAAFSFFQGHADILAIVTALLLCAGLVFVIINKNSKNKLMMYSVSLITGGGIGNLIDRIRLGYVIDFIDFRVFPVFNFADICVTCGCVLLCLSILLFEEKDKKA